MSALAVLAAAAAWLGASALVLAEGRRGLAVGAALFGAGLGGTLWAQPPAAFLLAAGGLVAGALRLRGGEPGWSLLPPGSTPRLLLCIVVGAAATFVGAGLMPGPGPAPARVAVVFGGAMAAARLLSTARRAPAVASTSVLCLALGGVEALVATGPWLLVAGVAAAAAALAGLLPAPAEEPPLG